MIIYFFMFDCVLYWLVDGCLLFFDLLFFFDLVVIGLVGVNGIGKSVFVCLLVGWVWLENGQVCSSGCVFLLLMFGYLFVGMVVELVGVGVELVVL